MQKTEFKNILIVDDKPKNLSVINDLFTESKLPYKIMNSPNGKIALETIEKKRPDLIITDWDMPEMDGIEFIKQLKSNKLTNDIPVIMCTGVMTSSENLETALDAGAVDYIRKPVDKIELIARTKANLHLAENYQKIKRLNKAKDAIFSVIAHDLKGPVGTIKSFIELILKNQSVYGHKKIMRFITLIGNQSASIFSVLENLLVWANSQRNNISYQPENQDISLAVNSGVNLLEVTANNKNIEIINEIDKQIFINFDLNLITTVIRNLIANAIKFTPKNGKINIRAKQTKTHLEISVTDTGIGICPERINNIFDETVSISTFGTNSEKGSGLGLKLCYDFIEKHKGKIWAESEEGKGSEFIFTLPKNEPSFVFEKNIET